MPKEMIKEIQLDELQTGAFIKQISGQQHDNPPQYQEGFLKEAQTVIPQLEQLGIDKIKIDSSRDWEQEKDNDEAPVFQLTEETRPKDNPEKQSVDSGPDHATSLSSAESGDFVDRAKNIRKNGLEIIKQIFHLLENHQKISLNKIETLVRDTYGFMKEDLHTLPAINRIYDSKYYLSEHAFNCMIYMTALSIATKVPEDEAIALSIGAFLQDVGKLRIPAKILFKRDSLNSSEFALIKKHVTDSYEMLYEVPGISSHTLEVVREHHERLDGSGYPQKLSGAEVSKGGRMAGIVDTFSAMTTSQNYSRGIPVTQAMGKLLSLSKTKYDMNLAQHFVKAVGIFPYGSLVILSSGKIGLVVEMREDRLLKPRVRVLFDSKRRQVSPPQEIDLAEIDPLQEKIADLYSEKKYLYDYDLIEGHLRDSRK